jgi:hypothetical protein
VVKLTKIKNLMLKPKQNRKKVELKCFGNRKMETEKKNLGLVGWLAELLF